MPHPTFIAAQVDYIARLNDAMRALDRRLESNTVINGDIKVWQRGTTFTGTAGRLYTADRWETLRGAGATGHTITRQTTSLQGFQYCARVQRDNGNASTQPIYFSQSIESADAIQTQSIPMFLTFRARCGANYSAASSLMSAVISSGTGTNQSVLAGFTGQVTEASVSVTLTTSWQTFTLAMPTGLSVSKTQLAVYFATTPVGTAGAADYFEVTGVQFVPGILAGTQIFRSFAAELALCQRFYWKTFPYATAPAQNAGNTGAFAYSVLVAGVTAHRWQIPLPATLSKAGATVTTYNPGAANANWRNTTDNADSGAATAAIIGERAVQVLNPGVAGDAVGEVCQIHVTVDAEL